MSDPRLTSTSGSTSPSSPPTPLAEGHVALDGTLIDEIVTVPRRTSRTNHNPQSDFTLDSESLHTVGLDTTEEFSGLDSLSESTGPVLMSDKSTLLERTDIPIDTDKEPASISSSVSNLTNTILGAGMLGLPYALATLGLGLGGFFLVLSACSSIFALHLLTLASRAVPVGFASYKTLSLKAFPKAAIVIDIAVAVKCFGVATSYLIVIGDVMPAVFYFFEGLKDPSHALADSVFAHRRFWIVCMMVLIAPLASLKRLNSLRYASYVAIATVVYLVFMVIFFFLTGDGLGDIVWVKLDLSFFKVLPIFVFSFTCHQNLFSIYNEMQGKLHSVNKSSVLAVGIAFWIYGLLGIFGFLTFGTALGSNIINEYDEGSLMVTIGRIAMTILVALSYPLQIHPCRRSLISLVSYFSTKSQSALVYWGITIFLVVVTFSISMVVTDLGLVFSLVGATGSTTIAYILPGLFYVRVNKGSPWYPKKIMAAALSIIGIVLMVVCVTFTIVNAALGEPGTAH
eukprot:TRINITY_DN1881_c0_g1_i1.p1 TRINITY_DN1881_c0_g1~~TRINITY_DN1881_c0_g1_i1.p1  ORF type:complete len:550 (+),score=85.01 TRINITY_DN1881_c0_g1_i1:116-1651(+)